MKIQIRYGIFETNSSSVHSLVYTDKIEDLDEFYRQIKFDDYLDAHFCSNLNVISSCREKFFYIFALICELFKEYGNNYELLNKKDALKKSKEVYDKLKEILVSKYNFNFIIYPDESENIFDFKNMYKCYMKKDIWFIDHIGYKIKLIENIYKEEKEEGLAKVIAGSSVIVTGYDQYDNESYDVLRDYFKNKLDGKVYEGGN